MTCPHCGAAVETTQRKWQRRMRELGRCQRCGEEKTGKDVARSYCTGCRKKISDRERRREAKHPRTRTRP